MDRLRLKDIARALNKSVSTVSKALSDSHEINPVTKREILEYAKSHNYKINRIASSLRTGKSYSIGIIVPSIGNAFFSQILEGMEEEIADTNYGLLIMQSKDDPTSERKCIDILYSRGIDGLIISPMGDNTNIEFLQALADNGLPIVAIDRINHKLRVPKIGITNEKSAYQAVAHLVQTGRSKIVHITGKGKGVIDERFQGYKHCLIDHGLTVNPHYLITLDLFDRNLDSIFKERINAILDREDRPDAIFTTTDFLTHKSLGLLKELGVNIPEDIAFLGYSNAQHSNAFSPALSCVFQPTKEMGRLAVAKCLNRYDNSNDERYYNEERIELDAQLIVRDSTLPVV